MSAEELVALLQSGNVYELMLRVNREFLERYHPEAAHGAVYVYHHDDTPPVRITIPVSASATAVR